jgi:hypothetical protein
VRVRGRGQIARALALSCVLLFGGCASAEPKFLDDRMESSSSSAPRAADTGSCRPWFKDSLFSDKRPPNHSCWNLLWEVPVALVAVPAAIGFATAPIWLPILLL